MSTVTTIVDDFDSTTIATGVHYAHIELTDSAGNTTRADVKYPNLVNELQAMGAVTVLQSLGTVDIQGRIA